MATADTSSLSSGLIPLSPHRSPSYRSSGFDSRGVLGLQLDLLTGGSFALTQEDSSAAPLYPQSANESQTQEVNNQVEPSPDDEQSQAPAPIGEPEQSSEQAQSGNQPEQTNPPEDMEHDAVGASDQADSSEYSPGNDDSAAFSLSSGLVPLSSDRVCHLQQRRQTAMELGAGLALLLGDEENGSSVQMPKSKKKRKQSLKRRKSLKRPAEDVSSMDLVEEMEVQDLETDSDFGDENLMGAGAGAGLFHPTSFAQPMSWMDEGEQKREEDEESIAEDALCGQYSEAGSGSSDILLSCQAQHHWQESTREGLQAEMEQLQKEAADAAQQQAQLPEDVRTQLACSLAGKSPSVSTDPFVPLALLCLYPRLLRRCSSFRRRTASYIRKRCS